MTNTTLTRRAVSALARLDMAGLGHMQRIDAIGKVLGFENGAALMSVLKASEAEAPAPSDAPVADEKPHKAVVIWDPRAASDYLLGEIIEDENAFKWSIASFSTIEELNAYKKGILDGWGWDQPHITEDTGAGHTPFIDAHRQNPNLTLAEWHNERMTEDLDDEDDLAGPS